MNDEGALAAIFSGGFRRVSPFLWPTPAQRVPGAPARPTDLRVFLDGEIPTFIVGLPLAMRVPEGLVELFFTPAPPGTEPRTSTLTSEAIGMQAESGEYWLGQSSMPSGSRYRWFARFVDEQGRVGQWSDPQEYVVP